MSHILIDNSKRYPDPGSINIPDEYIYDSKRGYWVNKKDGTAMMMGPKPPIPTSKKWDRETGEDQKGE